MPKISIPKAELKFETMRSSGPGGQYVNKASTKVRVRWNMEGSSVVTDEEKAKIRQVYANRITQDGEFLVECQVFRSQTKNKARVIERLHQLVAKALAPEKKRIPTKTPKWAKRKRIEEKREHGEKKKSRQKPKLNF